MRYSLKLFPITALAIFALAACDSGSGPDGQGALDSATDTVNQTADTAQQATEEAKEAVDAAAEKVEEATGTSTQSN
jgi:hypothetical protein